MASEVQHTTSTHDSQPEVIAMGYRPAVIPVAIFFGAALKNAGNVLTELAPWAYLGFTALLVGAAQLIQRRQHKSWPWGKALPVGFLIALMAWLGSMAIVFIFAPSEVKPG